MYQSPGSDLLGGLVDSSTAGKTHQVDIGDLRHMRNMLFPETLSFVVAHGRALNGREVDVSLHSSQQIGSLVPLEIDSFEPC